MNPMEKRPVAAEDLYRFALVFDAQLAPDGRHVIFCVRRVDDQSQAEYSNLWLVPTDGSAPPRQFTYGDQVDRLPLWSPDGRQIAFLSNRGHKKQFQVYLIPVDGGEARPLTRLQGEFGRLEWSPDGRRLACTFRKRDQEALEREADSRKEALGVVERRITRLIYKEDGYGFLPRERWHLWLIDADTGDGVQLTDGDLHDEYDPHWSPDGRRLVFRANRSSDPDRHWDQADLLLLPAEGGSATCLPTPPGLVEMPRFSPDGRWVAFYRPAGRDKWENTTLWVIPADGRGPARSLTDHTDLHIAQETLGDLTKLRTMPPTWSADSQRVYFQVTHHGNTRLMSAALAGGEPEVVIDGPGVVEEFHFDRAQRRLVYLFGTPQSPGELWLRELDSGQSRQLTRFNCDLLASLELGPVEEVWFKGPDGNNLQGWLIKPPHFDPAQTYPSILEIHGGPAVQYGNFFTHEFHYLAAQGYVVYFTNPRGSRGYGAAHTRGNYNNWGGPDYADLMAWVDVVQQQPYIDPARMSVTGGSYGGFMTIWIIGHTHRFQAAVAQRSVSNMISMDGSSDLAYRFDRLFGAEQPVWEDVDNYWRQSPLKYIGQAQTPTLVMHSEQDHRCDQEQSEQIFVALKKLGVDTELILFPAEGHGLSRGGRTDRRIARLQHLVRWFDKHLK